MITDVLQRIFGKVDQCREHLSPEEQAFLDDMSRLMETSDIHWSIWPNLQTAQCSSGTHKVQIVAFSGTYRVGSDGKPDAQLMDAVVTLACQKVMPEGLVLDLRDLIYVWGDDIFAFLGTYAPLGPDIKEIPSVIVSSAHNEQAFTSLAFGTRFSPGEIIFSKVEDALVGVACLIEKQTALSGPHGNQNQAEDKSEREDNKK